MKSFKSCIFFIGILLAGSPPQLHAQATLLLEEPYSYDGTFAGTGHAAVYLSRICAESPTRLRRCGEGQTGVVISRYHGIAGRDWFAIPLLPYLYAVNRAEDIPLFADARLVSFLREQYLSSVPLPAQKTDTEPRHELAGSAYDRTLYGFQIATRPEQDDDLIRILNSSDNRQSYKLLNRNCADFAKAIINFYYPHAIHRSVIADLGVTTPKQAAKSLVHFSKRHPELRLKTFLVPQVPGLKRSKPVHSVLESLVLAKKYVTPVLLFHPFVVGTVEAAYWAGWRFNPAKGALIFDPNFNQNFDEDRYPVSPEQESALQPPLTDAQRRSYAGRLILAKRANAEANDVASWTRLATDAQPRLDTEGRPFLEFRIDGRSVPVGLCPGNALRFSSPPEFLESLVLKRLEMQLKGSKPSRTSEAEVKRDWTLLQAARGVSQAAALAGTQ